MIRNERASHIYQIIFSLAELAVAPSYATTSLLRDSTHTSPKGANLRQHYYFHFRPPTLRFFFRRVNLEKRRFGKTFQKCGA